MTRRFLLGRAVAGGPMLIRLPRTGVDALAAPSNENHVIHEASTFMVPAASGEAVVANNGFLEIDNPLGQTIPYMKFHGISAAGVYYPQGAGIYAKNAAANNFAKIRFYNETGVSVTLRFFVFKTPYGE